ARARRRRGRGARGVRAHAPPGTTGPGRAPRWPPGAPREAPFPLTRSGPIAFRRSGALGGTVYERENSRPRRVLLTGWFSFRDGEATAGDVLAVRRVEEVLRASGTPYDVAWSPAFLPDALHLDSVRP